MNKYDAHPEQVALAEVFSSVTLLGPPMSEKVVKLVAHLFTPEEAAVARHLPFYYPRSLKTVARRSRRDPDEILPLLDAMSKRRVIYGGNKGYSLMPLIPGMFEYMLMNGVDSEWHRKYAELLTDLYSTGFVRNLANRPIPAVRNIPVQSVIESQNRVLDSDRISEMIDCHEYFSVLNVCQCRQSQRFIGKECKRSSPEDGCLVFGSFAQAIVQIGSGRAVSKSEMRDIVTERWEKKLVFLTGNVSPSSPNAICTCCDCCCHFIEAINHYDSKTLVAPPHFLAAVNESLCDNCGKCAKACNTYAHTYINKTHQFDREKCVGCSICVGLCKKEAIKMVENPQYKRPAHDFARLGLKLFPTTALAGLKAKLTR